MKAVLRQQASYNVWAHQQLIQTILVLPEEKQVQEMPSSFSSLLKTILHLWDAESIWWQRLKLQERIDRPSENFSGSVSDAVEGLLAQSRLWENWVNNATDLQLEHVFQYKTFDKAQFKQPVWQMLVHVFNHSTYHRGQLVTLLRQLGVSRVPATDFILWSRGKK